MKLMTNSKMRGFTMVEILLVVAAIGILMSLAVTQGLQFMENNRTLDAKAAQDTIADAVVQLITNDTKIPRIKADSSMMTWDASTGALADTDHNKAATEFVAALNKYLDGDMKLTWYSAADLENGIPEAGFFTAREDEWGVKYRVEFHADDNGLTGTTVGKVTAGGDATAIAQTNLNKNGATAKQKDTEFRVFIKSYGSNMSSPEGSFNVDNDDIYTMYQYVNSEYELTTIVRKNAEVSNTRTFAVDGTLQASTYAPVFGAIYAEGDAMDGTTKDAGYTSSCEAGTERMNYVEKQNVLGELTGTATDATKDAYVSNIFHPTSMKQEHQHIRQYAIVPVGYTCADARSAM